MKDQIGPSIENIPASSRTVCRGCNFLKVQPGVRGHDYHSNHYSCIHPVFNKNHFSVLGEGQSIDYNARQMPATPHWCPILKQKTIPTT